MSISSVLSALSDPNRLKIIDALKKRDMTVTEIHGYLPITMPTLSHHLDILRRENLVTNRRDGRQIIYSLNLSVLEDVAAYVQKLLSTGR